MAPPASATISRWPAPGRIPEPSAWPTAPTKCIGKPSPNWNSPKRCSGLAHRSLASKLLIQGEGRRVYAPPNADSSVEEADERCSHTTKEVRHMRRSIVLFTLGLLAIAARPGFAQQGQFSAIQGRVVDDSEAVLPGVVVVVTHQASGIYRQVVSNSDGSYYIAGIVPGPYRVTADLQGFKKYER